MRLTVQKAFVRQDCGRRYAAAMLRKSRPISKNYNVGDMVMYRCVQGALAPGEVAWTCEDHRLRGLQSAGVPVASAIHLLRPSSTAELLAHQLESSEGTDGYGSWPSPQADGVRGRQEQRAGTSIPDRDTIGFAVPDRSIGTSGYGVR